jgi:hypothetical protein
MYAHTGSPAHSQTSAERAVPAQARDAPASGPPARVVSGSTGAGRNRPFADAKIGHLHRTTEAAVLLLDWFWRTKPRRRKPCAHMGCGIKLPDLSKECILLWTRFELGDLRFKPSLLGCNVFLERVGNRSATLHDTTSCLRVLTVGFASPNSITCRPGYQFTSERSELGR